MTTLEREQLILNYIPLANKLAWNKNKTTPICVSIDDLKSAAYMGLVDAASRFNPSKGVAFGVYSRLRITGEMSDYLRSLMWSGGLEMSSIDLPIGENMSLLDTLEEDLDNTVESEDFFQDMIKSLTAIGKRIVKMYYVESMTLKEIGFKEGMSESRVSQLLKQYKQQIGRYFDENAYEYELAA